MKRQTGVLADRAAADAAYTSRTLADWRRLPTRRCGHDECGQRFRQEFVDQQICRDCLSVADTLAEPGSYSNYLPDND
jgi:hypothetical protein